MAKLPAIKKSFNFTWLAIITGISLTFRLRMVVLFIITFMQT